MRRVAYVSHVFPKLTETFTSNEVEGLAAAGLEVEPWTLRPAGPQPPALEALAARTRLVEPSARALGSALVRSPGLARLLAPRRAPRRLIALARGASLARTLQAERDHVHAQFPLEASSAALAAARAAGCTFSFSGHTYHRLDLMREKLATAAFVVVGSEFERELLCRRYGERWQTKIEVRRLGVPPRPQRSGFEPGTIVSLGTLGAKKGHDVLVRAVGELAARGVEARLEVIGEGPERPRLEQLVRDLGLGGRVRLAGALHHEAALAAVAGAAVFALACVEAADGDHDCLPVALMDAMSLGVPCVTSDAFGIPELIEDSVSGLLAPQDDAGEVAERLASLLRDPERAEDLGRAGRDNVRERYDLHTNVAALAELFRERLE